MIFPVNFIDNVALCSCKVVVGLVEVSRVDSNTHWSVTVQDAKPMSDQQQGFMRLRIEVE